MAAKPSNKDATTTCTKGKPMIRKILACFVIAVLSTGLFVGEVVARGGRGGRGRGGGGGYRGGGGYSRPASAASRSPSMSRPATPSASRPSASRPTASRPSGAARPSTGQRAATRPQTGASGARTAQGAIAQGGRPSQGQLNQFLNLPSQGSGGRAVASAGLGAAAGGLGAAGARRPAGANTAVADFLQGGAAAQSREAGSLASQRADNSSDSNRRTFGFTRQPW